MVKIFGKFGKLRKNGSVRRCLIYFEKLGFIRWRMVGIFKVEWVGFSKNECENECIIIRKWLDSEKVVDLWEVWWCWEMAFWENEGYFGWNECEI